MYVKLYCPRISVPSQNMLNAFKQPTRCYWSCRSL